MRRYLTELILNESKAALQCAAYQHHGQGHNRQDGECDQRELPVDERHQYRDRHQHQARLDKTDHPHADKLPYLVEVVGQPCHEIAGVHFTVKLLIQALQMTERVIPHVVLQES